MPEGANPGDDVAIQVQTRDDVAVGIHFLTLELEGGGMSRTADLVLQVEAPPAEEPPAE
jgi:hypothetical protein